MNTKKRKTKEKGEKKPRNYARDLFGNEVEIAYKAYVVVTIIIIVVLNNCRHHHHDHDLGSSLTRGGE